MGEGTYNEAVELAAILDTMADGLFVVDSASRIRRWNAGMERLTGYAAREVVGGPCSILRGRPSLDEAVPYEQFQCDVFAKGQVTGQETLIRRKDGTEVPVLASARVMRVDGGPAMGAVVTMTDLTPIRSLERRVSLLQREVQNRYRFHQLVAKSGAMQDVFGLIEMAAAAQATVLITGETGTGKELVAKAIHYASGRKDGPMVSVNCSALSESLLESELFGHVRGAFTGAVKDTPGRFELADGGTLFLDEVGDLPPLVQVKLLRVLQEHTIERVGEGTPRKVDVRVIAATHQDLRERVRLGEFREDLFYRLKVFPIHLPPLRDRKEDIPLLIERFVDRFSKETGKDIAGVAPDALRILMDYDWPGNVRELENAIEHAFVTCPEGYISPFDLPVELRRAELRESIRPAAPADGAAPRWTGPTEPAGPRSMRRRRPRLGREEFIALLDECDWNKAEVGRRLGITRVSVWRRMKALGIPLDPEAAHNESLAEGEPQRYM